MAARAHATAGDLWRARDILDAHLSAQGDPEAAALLAEVLRGMGDLPRAGALLFAAGARGPDADQAVAAWREHHADDFVALWRSLPMSLRAQLPRPARLTALRTKAIDALGGDQDAIDMEGSVRAVAGDFANEGGAERRLDAARVIAWVLAALFVACAVIGAATVLDWIVPG